MTDKTIQQHTPEPWNTKFTGVGKASIVANGISIFSSISPYADYNKHNAARIVACVNAMAGKSDPAEYVSRAEDLATRYNLLQLQYANVTDQRDELLDTVKRIREQAKQDKQHINGLTAQVQELTKERDELQAAIGDQPLHIVKLATAHREAVMTWETTLGRLTNGNFDQPAGLELLITTWRNENGTIRKAINADPNEATSDEVERLVSKLDKTTKECDELLAAAESIENGDNSIPTPIWEALQTAIAKAKGTE